MEYNKTVLKNGETISAEKLNKIENGIETAIMNIPGNGNDGGAVAIPSGVVVAWHGSENNVPDGWAICDGNNGTPDLSVRFILGANDDHIVGDSGGSEEVTLTAAQMPKHSHKTSINCPTYEVNYDKIKQYDTGYYPAMAYGFPNGSQTTETGSSKPHPNMPPYYTLLYIMKL